MRLPITTVIDVGANVGNTCLQWLHMLPYAHVHAVEALESFRPSLEKVAAEFPGRMSLWQVAASDIAGERIFYIHEDHPSSSSLLASTPESHDLLPFTRNSREINLQAVRLDELFESAGVRLGENILLKLDVQGAEVAVLRGCAGFLTDVACVICEVNLKPLYAHQSQFLDIIANLQTFGLEFSGVIEQFHDDEGRAIYLDAIFVRD